MNTFSPEIRNVDLWANRLDYSLRRYYVDSFYAKQIPNIKKGSRVLDLAGNKIQKRGQFNIEQYGLDVMYCNLTTAKSPDVQSDAACLPFANENFDVVICSELLEHVPDPPSVLKEAHRVLRKRGVMLICVPFNYQIHGDPYDFGRYTDYYWSHHLKGIGFNNIEIEKQGLFWSVLVDMLRAWLYDLQVTGNLRFKKIVPHLLAWAKRKAVKFDQETGHPGNPFWGSFTTGFGIWVQKG